MGRAGYNTHGKLRLRVNEFHRSNQEFVGSDTDKMLREKNKPQKGNSTIARETYISKGIIGLNIFASYLNKKFPDGGYTKEIILSWVKDIIKPEDIEKLHIYSKARSNSEVSTDDDAR